MELLPSGVVVNNPLIRLCLSHIACRMISCEISECLFACEYLLPPQLAYVIRN